MRNKDYRELQLSSSLLVFIFLAILILGIVIFLLGVSVGKKQAQIVADTGIPLQEEVTQVEKKEPSPAQETQEPKDLISKELASHQKFQEEAQKQKPAPKDFYYIQIGAFNKKEAAVSYAEQFKKEGYPTIILDPFSSDKRPVFRVRIGGFPSKEEAEKTKAELIATKKKKDFFIIKG
jgi:cell division septation protein DedD